MDILNHLIHKDFAGIRDYYAKELEKVEKQLQDVLENHVGDYKALDAVMKRYSDALRMYDRYYVLADQQKRGEKT